MTVILEEGSMDRGYPLPFENFCKCKGLKMQTGGTFDAKNIKITCVGARIALSYDMHKIFTVFQGTAPGKVHLFWNPKTGTTQFCNVSAHRNWDKPRKNGTVGRYSM